MIDNGADRLGHKLEESGSSTPRLADPSQYVLLSMHAPSETAPAMTHRPIRLDGVVTTATLRDATSWDYLVTELGLTGLVRQGSAIPR